MTGPVLFFLGLDNGPEFLVRAAKGTELAAWGFGAFLLAFAYTSGVARWLPSLLAGIAGYFAVAAVTQSLDISLGVRGLGDCSAGSRGHRAVAAETGHERHAGTPARLGHPGAHGGDVYTRRLHRRDSRSAGTAALGLVASYPVILTVIATFTLRQWGRDAALRLFKGVALSLQAFVGFFFVVGMATPALGKFLLPARRRVRRQHQRRTALVQSQPHPQAGRAGALRLKREFVRLNPAMGCGLTEMLDEPLRTRGQAPQLPHAGTVRRRFAHGSRKRTMSIFRARRQRLAATSGTMPMPAPAATMPQTASKPVTRARIFSARPWRVALPVTCRCSALSRGRPMNARLATSAKPMRRERASVSPLGTTSTSVSSRNGKRSIVSGSAAIEAMPISAAPDYSAAGDIDHLLIVGLGTGRRYGDQRCSSMVAR